MSNKPESAAERIERMKREKQEAKGAREASGGTELVGQLTHQSDGEPDFSVLAKRLEERKAQEAKGENEGHVKMTIYIEENLANAFNALATERGQKKKFANQALRDFVLKKSKELGL